MEVLIYIGITVVLLSLIPLVYFARWMHLEQARYRHVPLKLAEIRGDYRRRRWTVFLIQMAGIAIALLGCYL